MARIAIGGFQHETNTFAPSKADYAAFEAGGGWPGVQYGDALFAAVEGANIPAAGAIEALRARGHTLVGTAWAAASPSAHVTAEAFERIAGKLIENLVAAAPRRRRLSRPARRHGDGELRRRRRRAAAAGARRRRAGRAGGREPRSACQRHARHGCLRRRPRRLPNVSARRHGASRRARRRAPRPHAAKRQRGWRVPSISSTTSPAFRRNAPSSSRARASTRISPTSSGRPMRCFRSRPGFPMADFAECGMAVFGYGANARSVESAVAQLRDAVAASEKDFALELHSAAACRAARAQRRRAGGAGGAGRYPGQPGRRRQRRHHGTAAHADRAERARGGARHADRSGVGRARARGRPGRHRGVRPRRPIGLRRPARRRIHGRAPGRRALHLHRAHVQGLSHDARARWRCCAAAPPRAFAWCSPRASARPPTRRCSATSASSRARAASSR